MDDVASVTVLKGPNAAALYGSRASNGAVVITTKNARNALRGTQYQLHEPHDGRPALDLPEVPEPVRPGLRRRLPVRRRRGRRRERRRRRVVGPQARRPSRSTSSAASSSRGSRTRTTCATTSAPAARCRTTSPSSQSFENAGARLSITRDDIKGIVPNSSLGKLAELALGERDDQGEARRLRLAAVRAEQGHEPPGERLHRRQPVHDLHVVRPTGRRPVAASQVLQQGQPVRARRRQPLQLERQLPPQSVLAGLREPGARFARSRRRAGVGELHVHAVAHAASSAAAATRIGSRREQQFAKGNIDNASASFNGGVHERQQRARRRRTSRRSLTAKHELPVRRPDAQRRRQPPPQRQLPQRRIATSGILVPGIYNLANAGIAPTVTNSEFHSAVNSAYGSAVATVNKYWTVEVTGRNDWSSTLPKENASYFYPSVSSALVLSDMFPALANNRWLSYLKLRGGWTRVGSDAGPYQLATVYNGSSNKFGGLPLFSLANQLEQRAAQARADDGAGRRRRALAPRRPAHVRRDVLRQEDARSDHSADDRAGDGLQLGGHQRRPDQQPRLRGERHGAGRCA